MHCTAVCRAAAGARAGSKCARLNRREGVPCLRRRDTLPWGACAYAAAPLAPYRKAPLPHSQRAMPQPIFFTWPSCQAGTPVRPLPCVVQNHVSAGANQGKPNEMRPRLSELALNPGPCANSPGNRRAHAADTYLSSGNAYLSIGTLENLVQPLSGTCRSTARGIFSAPMQIRFSPCVAPVSDMRLLRAHSRP